MTETFEQIVNYTYPHSELDKDILNLISQNAYQPSFSAFILPYLKKEAKHFTSFFNNSEPFSLTIDHLGIICTDKMQPSPQKIKQFLSDHCIETPEQQADFKKAINEEYFGSGFIHRYKTTTEKDNLIYLYDMVENPFYTLYTFAHELTHAMQDKTDYYPYHNSKKEFRTDYREIHANLTAGTFMMIKASQTNNPDIIEKTKQNILWLSGRMSNIMKTPTYGIRYFDWKGINLVLTDIPHHYKNMLTNTKNIDWNKVYTYTTQKMLEMDYTPAKINEAKKILEQQLYPFWEKEKNNQKFLTQIIPLKGKNKILDDFIEGFNYFMTHPARPDKKVEEFYQQLARPKTRSQILHSKIYDDIPNITLYRKLDIKKRQILSNPNRGK